MELAFTLAVLVIGCINFRLLYLILREVTHNDESHPGSPVFVKRARKVKPKVQDDRKAWEAEQKTPREGGA